ncbi:MAG: hypothetical protein IPM74_07190 [Crocinitomicaceae bacterium]|nr:hypothetical protein [Crocinitomicaceae bacterium]MBK8925684.1 hypothetical protein [Crocinitomicaceae bacterium]
MKKRLLYILLPALSLLTACGADKIEQGQLEYTITYPGIQVSGFTLSMLPDEMTCVFKGTKVMTSIKRGKLFSTQIITDESTKSVEMRLEFGSEHAIYTILTAEEITQLKNSQPVYDVVKANHEDSVAGLWASEYVVTCKTDSANHETSWFTTALTPKDPFWFSSYSGIEGMPLIYDIERYDVLMRLSAVKFSEREVQDKEFDRNPELKEVSFQEYEAIAQELFDILME